MSDRTSSVGSMTLPVPAGSSLSSLEDVTLLGLLDYLGFWLKLNLDPKLANLTPTSIDACPVANRFPFDPEGTYVRNDFPALYAWPVKSTRQDWTLLYEVLVREIKVMYLFEELVKPDGMEARHGLYAAVDKTFMKAAERGRHAEYRYNDDWGFGDQLARQMNWRTWEYLGADYGFLSPIPGGSTAQGGSGTERQTQSGYPAVMASFRVFERVDQDDFLRADLGTDLTMTISTGDSTEDVTEFMQRFVEHNDGSES